jgi:hypothetical protein
MRAWFNFIPCQLSSPISPSPTHTQWSTAPLKSEKNANLKLLFFFIFLNIYEFMHNMSYLLLIRRTK